MNLADRASSSHPVIGILGGMGPRATVELMQRVIAATPAVDDGDHIHLLVDNNPKVPSRIAALLEGGGEDPLPELKRMAQNLQRAGATALAIACNTAHLYARQIESTVEIPLLDMIELSAERIAGMPRDNRRVGLLASTAVINTRLYETALAKQDLQVVHPRRQDDLMEVIRTIKAGSVEPVRDRFSAIAGELASTGVDTLLVACTELSIVCDAHQTGLAVVDSLDVLVDEIVKMGLRR